MVARSSRRERSAQRTLLGWFWERGYEVVAFTRDELLEGRLDDDLRHRPDEVIVVGAVGVVRDAVVRAGRPAPQALDFPESLREFLGRRLEVATMGDVRAWVRAESPRLPAHIKPRHTNKLFTGKVVRAFRDLQPMLGVDDDEPVFVQECVDFVSEWRATILRGRILNVAHYTGDPLRFPSVATLQAALAAHQTPPIGYAMDWGVLADGRTVLVEVNDGFSLGNYGLRGPAYTALIECRWRELMGLPDNGMGNFETW